MLLIALAAGDKSEMIAVIRCSEEEAKALSWVHDEITKDELELLLAVMGNDVNSSRTFD